MRRYLACCLVTSLALILHACHSQGEVDSTIPQDGQRDVPARSIVAVRLSTTMSAADVERNTDARNIVVTGDQSEAPYSGTITTAEFGKLFSGQTVEQFQQGGAGGETPPPTDGEPAAGPVHDTLVFLLDDGVSFKAGERIQVFIDNGVAVRGATVDSSMTFSFVVEGGAAGADGEFFVASAEPALESRDVGLSPTMRATFSQAARNETLAGGIHVSGSQSGVHEDGSTIFDTSAATNDEVARRLASDRSFLPGEEVRLSFNSSIRSGDVALSPFTTTFQVKPGEVTGVFTGARGWEELTIVSDASGVAHLLAADFLPDEPGIEFVAVHPEQLALYSSTETGTWVRRETPIEVEGELRGAFAVDMDEDGIPDVALVLEADPRSRVVRYSAASGDLQQSDVITGFPAAGISSVQLGDLSSDGRPEIIVTHADTTFTPTDAEVAGGDTAGPRATGQITFLELRAGPPPGAEIDPLDPDALLSLNFHRVERPVARFETSRRIVPADLDGDGRVDLVVDTAEGLLLYRNQSTRESSFLFRRVGFVTGSDGSPLRPDAWTVADLDRDHDFDLLAFSASAGLFFENRQPARGTPPESGTPAGLLFETVAPRDLDVRTAIGASDQIVVTNIDGDPEGTPDLVVKKSGGDLAIILGSPDAVIAFETPRVFPGGSAVTALALADINADTGLDVIFASGGDIGALATESELVEPVVPPTPSSFALERVEDAPDGEVHVLVRGDITTRFSGYALALDYDETVLTYLGFTIPDSFARTATFELCPNALLLGCPGTAFAGMKYQRDTVGSASSGVVLGTFRFRAENVEEEQETEIVLSDFRSADRDFRNEVTTVEGSLRQPIAVDRLGDPISITLTPPDAEPQAELAVQCSVVERFAAEYLARVNWQSPRGTPFAAVIIRVNGQEIPESPVSWENGSIEFTDDTGGLVALEVIALRSAEEASDPPEDLPRLSCSLVSVFQPQVVCESRIDSNVVRWSLEDHAVDNFNVYRNGVRIGVVSGQSDFVFEDRFPSPAGADSYSVAGVIASQEGPRGTCRGQDPSPCSTLEPTVLAASADRRTLPSSPNVVRYRWRNGEAYDALVARLYYTPLAGGDEIEVFPGGRRLGGGDMELAYEGDRDRGGAVPGVYRFTLQGRVTIDDGQQCPGAEGELESAEVAFPEVTVAVPDLSTSAFTCVREGLSDLRLSWLPLWRGYNEFLGLTVRHVVEGEETSTSIPGILLGDTGVLLSSLGVGPIEPIGRYEITLSAVFEDQELEVSCTPVSFVPTLTTGDVEAGIGLGSFDIPILASGVFNTITAYEIELDVPDFVTVNGFETIPGESGRKRITLRQLDTEVRADPRGDRQSDGNVEIARLRASIPADFSLVSRSPEPLSIENAKLRLAGGSDLHSVESEPGRLLLRQRFVVLDRGTVAAGSTSSVRIAVRATFQAPPQAPDYKFNAFQIHLAFDHNVLELITPTEADQAGTVLGDDGSFILPTPDTVAEINRTGDLKIAWLGFDFLNPTTPMFLEPVTNREILIINFKTRLPATAPATFAAIEFVTDPTAEQPTAFFPVVDVPGVPDMEAFIAGGIDVTSDAPDLSIAAVEPGRGALTGGNRVSILGRGLPVQAADLTAVRFVSQSGDALPVVLDSVEFVSSAELSVVVPDSGLRAATFFGARLYNIEVETPRGSAQRRLSYAFEAPVLQSADVTSVHANSGDFIRLTGVGLSVLSTVELRVDGFSDPFPVEIFRIDPDGTEIVVVASGLPAPPAGQDFLGADLRVLLPESTPLTLGTRLRILPPTGDTEIEIAEIQPEAASYCGGEVITVLGGGFTAATSVEFGGQAGTVDFVSSRELHVVVPFIGEPGPIPLRIRDGVLVIEAPYSLTPPPDFIRGDVDGDRTITMEDATILSAMVLNGAVIATEQRNRDAWDVNDDGVIHFGDSLMILAFLFEGGTPPSSPFPTAGQDPDNLSDSICQ